MSARYTIWLDGLAYRGETAESEPAENGGVPGGWGGRGPHTRSGIAFAMAPAMAIEGTYNLASHLDRIIRRARAGQLSFRELTIRSEP